jgi:hypothetical protein
MKVPYKVIVGILGVIGAIVWSIQGVNYNEVISAFTTINLFFAGTVL